MLLQTSPAIDTVPTADKAATSFGHAVQICLDMQQDHVKTGAGRVAT
jgi:hypothetical protein